VKNVIWQLFQGCCIYNFYFVILPNLTINERLLDRKRHLKMWLSTIVILIWLCKKLLPRPTKFAAHQAIMCSQHSWIFIPRFHKTNKIMCHVIQEYKSLYAMIHIAGLMSILFSFCCIMFATWIFIWIQRFWHIGRAKMWIVYWFFQLPWTI
jgi:hypothetical protein